MDESRAEVRMGTEYILGNLTKGDGANRERRMEIIFWVVDRDDAYQSMWEVDVRMERKDQTQRNETIKGPWEIVTYMFFCGVEWGVECKVSLLPLKEAMGDRGPCQFAVISDIK